MADSKRNTDGADGSYNALVRTMGELKKAWRATTDETERASIGKQILDINSKLKEMDASIGNYQRNVGDYANSFKTAMGDMTSLMSKDMQSAVSGVSTQLEGLKKALTAISSHPIIAVLVVIVGILLKCYQAFANTAEGANKLSQAFSSANGVGIVFEKLMQSIGAVIANVIIPAFNALMEVVISLIEGLGIVSEFIGGIFGSEGLQEAGATMRNIREETEKSAEAERKRQQIQKATNALRVKESKEIIKIEELRAKAQDKENYSLKERKKFAEEAHKIEQAILDEKIKIAKANLQLIKQENARSGSSKEALEKERQLEIELNNLIAQKNRNERTYNQQNNRMNKEAKREAKQAENEQEKRNKAEQKYLDYKKQEVQIAKELVNRANYYNRLLTEREEKARYNKEINEINNTKGLSKQEREEMLGIATTRYNVNMRKINEDYKKAVSEQILAKNKLILEEEEKFDSEYEGSVSDFYDDLYEEVEDYYDKINELEVKANKERRKLLEEELKKDKEVTKLGRSFLLLSFDDEARRKERERFIESSTELEKIRKARTEAEIQEMRIQNEALYNENLKQLNQYGIQYLQIENKNSEEAIALREETLSLENEMEMSYYDNQVDIAQKRLDDIKLYGKGVEETMNDYKERVMQAEAEVNEALNRQSEVIYELNHLQMENDNSSQTLGFWNFSISESVEEMREAKFELENIYQEEGENFEAYLARKLSALERYNNARGRKIEAEIKSWSSLATSIGNITDSIIDYDNNRLQAMVENGEISEEQAEKQFESNKKFQIATAVVSMLAGATGIFMDTMRDHTIQPTWLRPALAATQAAGVLASGAVQIQKIKQAKFGGSTSGSDGGGSMASGAMSASVTPLLDENLDVNSYTQLNTENTSNERETKVYVVESDIRDVQNKVDVRENSSSF